MKMHSLVILSTSFLITLSTPALAEKCKTKIYFQNQSASEVKVTKVGYKGGLLNYEVKENFSNIKINSNEIKNTGKRRLNKINKDSEGQFKVYYRIKTGNKFGPVCQSIWQTQVCDDQVALFIYPSNNQTVCLGTGTGLNFSGKGLTPIN